MTGSPKPPISDVDALELPTPTPTARAANAAARPPSRATGAPRKAPKRPYKNVPKITPAQYNALWEGYIEKPVVAHAARRAGLNRETAERYITGAANPAAGMEPIRERWLRVQAAAQEEQELDVLTLRRSELGYARKQLLAIHAEMELALADARRRVQEYNASGGTATPQRELDLQELVNAYDRAVRTAEHLLGGPDVSVGRAGFDPLDALTEEEALAYATTGILPAGVRAAVAAFVPRKERKR